MEMKLVYPVYFNELKDGLRVLIPDLEIEKILPKDTELYRAISISRTLIDFKIAELLNKNKEIPEKHSSKIEKPKNAIITYVDLHYTEDDEEVEDDEEDAIRDSKEENKRKNRWETKENVFEFFSGDLEVSATLHKRKYINKIRKYADEYPDEVKIIAENADGSIFAKFPVGYIRLTKPATGREFTEEEKEANRKRLEKIREKKSSKNEDGRETFD